VHFVAGTASAAPPRLDRSAVPGHTGDGLAGLIGRDDPTFGVVLLSLLVAAFWGAAHALTPGHGKALVAGYLVGTRGRPRHAFALGATVTVTHTAGVFGLGLVTLGLSTVIVPEQLYPWLTLVSGVLVVGVGTGVLVRRARHAHGQHHHDHAHHHAHHHHHDPQGDIGVRGILGIGAAAGLLPCPSALVVLLSAIALHRLAFGLALIVAFSVGLAATITAIGLVAVLARRAFGRARLDGPLIRALPALSAAVIVAVGLVITVKAIPAVI
jgi:ABC-type nickel/cobalt efflux system permease component RcnA